LRQSGFGGAGGELLEEVAGLGRGDVLKHFDGTEFSQFF
jgi:hypothetical protein